MNLIAFQKLIVFLYFCFSLTYKSIILSSFTVSTLCSVIQFYINVVFCQALQTTDTEVNYLRMIHLLFRVVAPVVRTFFDYEIEPKQLQNILNEHQMLLRKQYRQKDNIFDDAQWSLLFGKTKGI